MLVRSRPSIEAGYLERDGHSLFHVVYRCRIESEAQRHGILICQPLGHEYARAYRNVQQLAVQLCQAGHPVMRFDYAGTGNSTGGCEEFTAESLLADVQFAANHMREALQLNRLSIVGLRIGATIASHLEGYDELIAWDPVIQGNSFLSMLREFHDTTLNSQTRFSRKVVGVSDQQLYGHRMSTEQICDLSELKFSAESKPERTLHLVLSEGYAEAEPEFSNMLKQDSVTSVQTLDQVYWQRPEFAEQAFSSPEAFETIKQILKD